MTTATKTLRYESGETIKCSETVYSGGFGGYNCSRNATVLRGDKYYCTIHDIVRHAEKRKERNRLWQEKWDRERAERAKCKAKLVQRIVECDDPQAAAALFDEIRRVR